MSDITDQRHEAIINRLQSQITDYYRRQVPFRVYHGSTNSTRILSFKRSEMVDTSELNRILSIDVDKRIAVVESNVPMDKLVKATLKYGLIPEVVPEFPGITVGGAIQGTGAETSSHKYGCVSETANWTEYILGNGTKVRASRDECADLFYGAAGACGSLGLITAAAIRLIPAPRYVQISSYVVSSAAEGIELMTKQAAAGTDFVEWGMLGKQSGVVVIGTMSDKSVGKIRRFSRPFDTWYYLYLKDIAARGVGRTDCVPIKDYLFRYNRGAFWAAELAFQQSGVPSNALTRFVLDPLLRTRKLYQAIQASAASQTYLCQDLVIPKQHVAEFLDFIDERFAMYPIGGCPIRPETRSPLQCTAIDAPLVYNIGVYGLRIEPYDAFVAANRDIEIKTHELGGKKWFYAHNFYPADEFWNIYDKKWYDDLRQKYHAEYLPDIYERTRVKEQHRVSKRRGVLYALLGLAKLKIIP